MKAYVAIASSTVALVMVGCGGSGGSSSSMTTTGAGASSTQAASSQATATPPSASSHAAVLSDRLTKAGYSTTGVVHSPAMAPSTAPIQSQGHPASDSFTATKGSVTVQVFVFATAAQAAFVAHSFAVATGAHPERGFHKQAGTDVFVGLGPKAKAAVDRVATAAEGR